MLRNVLIILAAALSLLPFVGCKSKAAEAKYKIAVIPKGSTHEFWQSIERGSLAAAKALGDEGITVEVIWDAPLKESDASDQIGRVQRNADSRGIHGLVLAPQDSKAMVPVVAQTVEKKIPVVIIDSGLDKEELFVKYVATDNYNGGKLAAKHLLEVLEKQGKSAPKLALFRYQPGSESTEQRERGFLDGVKQKADALHPKPGPEVINDKVYSGATVDSAQKNAVSLLNVVKDKVDGIFAVNESATNGLLNEMRSRELNKKIVLMGFDSSGPLRQAVEEGDVVGLIVQDPYRMGYLGVWTLVRHLEGDDVSKGGKNFSTGEYLVTKDNVGNKEIRQLFDPKLQVEREIELPQFGKK